MSIIITAHEDGTATALHTDAIPLQSLGALTVKRASTVEFNETSQEWEVRLHDALGNSNAVYYTNQSRAACIAWEIEQLNGKV